MGRVRRRHSAAFKAKVVVETLKQEKTTAHLSGEYGVDPNRIAQWRKKALAELPEIFSSRRKKEEKDRESLQSELYRPGLFGSAD